MIQVFQQGEAATLVTYPPAAQRGTVATATVRVSTPAVSLPDTGEAATLSTLDTTASASADAGTRVINAVDATGATPGRKALFGETLVMEIESVDADVITLVQGIPEDLATGFVIKGLDITIALDSTDTATVGNALALWTFDGIDVPQPFAVSHRAVNYQLDTATLFHLAPFARRLLSSEDLDGHDAMAAAWELEVARHLLNLSIKPEEIRSWDAINTWHATAVVHFLLTNSPRPDPDEVARWHSYMVSKRSSALDSRRFWTGDNAEVGTQPDDPVNLSRVSFRR